MTRTCDLRIRNPLNENDNASEIKDLEQTEKTAYTPAYKDCSDDSIPSELVEIIEAWNELPQHVKQTIRTLVSVTSKEKNQ